MADRVPMAPPRDTPDSRVFGMPQPRFIDLSHTVEDGLITYPVRVLAMR